MNINILINASQVIGRGLAQQACRIELMRIGGMEYSGRDAMHH